MSNEPIFEGVCHHFHRRSKYYESLGLYGHADFIREVIHDIMESPFKDSLW